MRTLIRGGLIFTPHKMLNDHMIVIEDGKILDVLPRPLAAGTNERFIDASGYIVAPGYMDIHVHGAAGADTMDATTNAIHTMARFFATHGVTSYFPTTISHLPGPIQEALENIASCPQPLDGAQHLGGHVEGPYLNPEYKGAQPGPYLRDADPTEYERWLATSILKLVTIAPERKGAMAFIERGIASGVEFAVGHSGASYDQVLEAADRGLRQATHTFNGMLGLHHRRPGTVGAVLSDDRIYAQVIADGIHLHPAVLKLLVRAKTPARTILITDAIRATGLPDGEYELGGEPVIAKGGVVRNRSGNLAGSTLTMDIAVRNTLVFTGLSLSEVLPMATSVPAEAMHLSGQKGIIAQGADADLILLDTDLKVQMTLVGGRLVYRSG